jgi:hypothetical protein
MTVSLLLYVLSIVFKGQIMIYEKHFSLKIEQHEPKKTAACSMGVSDCNLEQDTVKK